MHTARPLHQVVTVACCLAFTLGLGACGATNHADSNDISEELKESIIAEAREDIISEAVDEMHPTIASAVNEAVEECELAGQTAIEDFQACLMVQSGEPLEDTLLLCTPDPPSCDTW